jgi:hypothetical protein
VALKDDITDPFNPTVAVPAYDDSAKFARIDIPTSLAIDHHEIQNLITEYLPQTVHMGFYTYTAYVAGVTASARGEKLDPSTLPPREPPVFPEGTADHVAILIVLKDSPKKGLSTTIPVWTVLEDPDAFYFMIEKRVLN